jgi:hypothetical protein
MVMQEDVKLLLSDEAIISRIYTIRGMRVMIDRDLAILYQVETKALNQAVRRNLQRFPHDFMFQLSPEERGELVTKWRRFSTGPFQ